MQVGFIENPYISSTGGLLILESKTGANYIEYYLVQTLQ